MKPVWLVKSFETITGTELYAILKLRSEVFVVEQDCVYLDADGKDKDALHLFAMDGANCIAYLRMMDIGMYYKENACIGRVVIHPSHRGKHLAYALVAEAIAICKKEYNNPPIKISAQKHLQHFYEKCGFKFKGEDYLEDGIPHCAMYR